MGLKVVISLLKRVNTAYIQYTSTVDLRSTGITVNKVSKYMYY